MSGSARKRISKWDLKDAPELSLGERPYDDWPGKEDKFVSNKESQPGWQPTEFAGSNDPKWYSVEANNKDGREFSDATMTWDGDGSYGTKMSPGLDDWRQRNRSRSPKSISGRSYRSRSRSRSRSPARGFRRESGLNDRNTASRPCKDFAAGRCRRGDRCQYLHQDDGDYKDRRYSEGRLRIGRSNNLCNDFYKGKCHRGTTCRYGHDSAASDGFGKGSASEVFRERESDRRTKGALFEHSRDHESRRSGDIPCKFFAAGNCRNGKFCRFSHQGQRRASPDDRSRDDWRRPSSYMDNVSRESIKWSDKSVSDVAKLQEWRDDRYEDASAPGRRATERSMHNRWEHTSNNESRSWDPPNDSGKTLESNERNYLHSKEENTGAGMGVSESRGADIWLPDMDISPTWNGRVQSSNHIIKEELSHIVQTSPSPDVNGISLPTCDQDITREALGQKHHATIQPMISENSCDDRKTNRESAISTTDLNFSANVLPAHSFDQNGAISTIDLNFSADVLPARSFDQNGQSSSAVTEPISSLNAVGQHQQMFLPLVPRGENVINLQNHQLFQEEKSFNKPDVGVPNKSEVTSEVPPNKNIVNREQLSQLTDLSVSLARFFGNGQQLPQLCTAVNPQRSVDFVQSSLPDSAEPVIVLAEAYSQQNQAIDQKQYDPVSDSVEMSKPDVNNSVPGYSTNFIEKKSVEDGKQGILAKNLYLPSITGGLSGADLCKTGNLVIDLNHESLQLNKLDPVVNCEGEEKNGTAVEERNKAQDNDPLEKMDGDSKADKGKKNNDAKGIRAFKFALVEFVKDLLKPMWKEGQVSKEAHKTIVKKVVDKVMGSIQGAHIPQSQEKIDNYLSSSKPKLTKLVQAYLEKFQKS